MAKAETKKNLESEPVVDTLTVTVDGKAVEVPKTMPDPMDGRPIPTTMIQACKLAGAEVPHFCYHPKLPVAGNCRMCLVEFGTLAMDKNRKPIVDAEGQPVVRKMPRPAIACATPVSPNMEIYTQSEGTVEMRRAVMEFLLINHPLDCPICDQAGECRLQEYSVDHGQGASRFVEQKVHKPKQVDLGPRIMLDDERCILCSRCIRFTRDIAGDDALGFVDRGSHSTLAHYPNRPFDNNYTLNTVDICPVGALTSKDFRFQMRVWFLKESSSICSGCATGCNITVGSRENRIYRFTPRENDAVNSSWMCDAGRLDYKWVGREDRLKNVQVRNNDGVLVPSDWSRALGEIADILREVPEDSVALIASARLSNEELYLLNLLAGKLGAVTDSIPRKGDKDALLVHADKNPNMNGAIATGISTKRPGSKLKLIAKGIKSGALKTLIVFGENLSACEMDDELLSTLEHLIVCDILPNETTASADYLLPGCSHLEKRGTFINAKGRVQKFMRAVEQPGDSRPEWEFLLELLKRIDGTNGVASIEGLFNQMAADVPALDGVSWGDLGETGVSIEI
jgi:NADH-quinone oxidoreductase subunit G